MPKLSFSLLQETVVDLPRAAALLHETLPAVVHWASHGLDGVRIETEYSEELGELVTSEEALGRFLEAVNWVTV